MSSHRPKVVFVLGGPGSGKGTQCVKLAQKYKFLHLSAGDLLREERNKEASPFREEIEHHIVQGSIVPVEITVKLIDIAMQQTPSPLVLVDGFPRNQDNLDGWERHMNGRADVQFVLLMDCDVQTCIKRCLSRGQGRSDDNEETLKKRVETFNNQTAPIIQHYDKLGMVRKIDASKSPEVVFGEVEKAVKMFVS